MRGASPVPTNTDRVFDEDLKRASIPKHIPGVGKLDFHACRTTYATLIVESGATVKEAQTLLRHCNPSINMNTCTRTREVELKRVAEQVGCQGAVKTGH